MGNIVIIGSGPAGISAALYAVRAGVDTTIISKGSGALEKAEMIENYYGFSDGISGKELEKSGIDGALRLGVKIVYEEVAGIGYDDKLVVQTIQNGKYKADSVIIATGSPRNVPKIKGLTEYEGKGVSYCAVCDAFFYRNKDVCVLGNSEYALHEANELINVVKSVTILTNGIEPSIQIFGNISMNTKKISELCGGGEGEGESKRLNFVKFEDDTEINTSGLFVALGTAGSTALAKKIGALTEGNKIVVDENMSTNIPGLYAAGDCTGGMLQIAKAVYEGAKSGIEAAKYVKKLK